MKRWFNSVGFAIQGVSHFLRTDRNGRIELCLAIVAIALGVILKIDRWEWSLLIICIGLGMAAEMFNHAIEKTSDLITREPHPDIGLIKDVAAGAVFLIAIMSMLIGCIIFLPKIVIRFLV